MSTRCQIAFITKWNDQDGPQTDERWVYRHSDGYTGDGTLEDWGVLYDLQQFIAWNRGRMRDTEYASANFLFWSKFQHCGSMELAKSVSEESVPRQLLGFGVCQPGRVPRGH